MNPNPVEGNFQMNQLWSVCPNCGFEYYFKSTDHYGYCNNCGIWNNVITLVDEIIEKWRKEKEKEEANSKLP
jgi:anaerobic ribonucleoside-triphosphate reductase